MNNKPKILMVDDEEDFIHFLKLNLEKTGKYQVYALTSPAEALRLAEVCEPDLALLDIMMPQMSGAKLAEQLRDMHPTKHIPVLFLTALIKPEEESYINTRHEFIAKPVSPAVLIERIDRIIGKGN